MIEYAAEVAASKARQAERAAKRQAETEAYLAYMAERDAAPVKSVDTEHTVTVDGTMITLNEDDFRTLAQPQRFYRTNTVARSLVRQRVEINCARNYGVDRDALVDAVQAKDRQNRDNAADAGMAGLRSALRF